MYVCVNVWGRHVRQLQTGQELPGCAVRYFNQYQMWTQNIKYKYPTWTNIG